MSTDSPDRGEGFLSRWSRVKTEARDASAEPSAAPPAAVPTATPQGDTPPPELPPIEELTLDSDFSDFFHPKVNDDVRRAALKKLFSDPHFNVMDGLDVYIDDYSKTEPIPAAMLASLKQAQRIFEWAAEKKEDPPQATPPAEAAAESAAIEPPTAPEDEPQSAASPAPGLDPVPRQT